MKLIDIRAQHGPYWAAYQAERQRADICDNPAMVPEWFIVKLATERVAAARVGLEKAARPDDSYAQSVFEALRVVELFLGSAHTLKPDCAQVVAGLLGAQEISRCGDHEDSDGSA